jgi:hypothetical protein
VRRCWAFVVSHARQIRTGTEGTLAGPRDDQNPDLVVIAHLGRGVAKGVHHFERHRIASVRAIDRDSGYRTCSLELDDGHRGIVGNPVHRGGCSLASRGVWLLVLTLVAAILVVLCTFGSFAQLSRLRVTGVWLLFAGLGVQIALEFIDLPRAQFDTTGYGLLMLSYAFILAFCLSNLITRGFGIIAIGVAMNTLVIGLNQGMPSIAIGNDDQGNRVREPFERTVKHRPERDSDLLQILDDRIAFPDPLDTVVSFGDLVVSVGICELAYYASRRRRRRGVVGQAGTASVNRRPTTRSRAPRTRPS